jgi:hypothetical protein
MAASGRYNLALIQAANQVTMVNSSQKFVLAPILR